MAQRLGASVFTRAAVNGWLRISPARVIGIKREKPRISVKHGERRVAARDGENACLAAAHGGSKILDKHGALTAHCTDAATDRKEHMSCDIALRRHRRALQRCAGGMLQ